MGRIVINGKAANALLKAEKKGATGSFLDLVKPITIPQPERAPRPATPDSPSGQPSSAAPQAQPPKTQVEASPEGAAISDPTLLGVELPEEKPPQRIQLKPVLQGKPILHAKLMLKPKTLQGIPVARKEEAVQPPQPAETPAAAPVKDGLFLRILDQTKWLHKNVPINIDLVMIGSDPRTCDVIVDKTDAEQNHVALRRLGDQWHVIECAQKRTLFINGRQCPQILLSKGASCVLRLGSRRIIVSVPPDESEAFDPKSFTYLVAGVDGKSFRQKMEESFLIGSDPLCKFKLADGQPFEGVVFHNAGRLYLYSFNEGSAGLSSEGAPAVGEAPRPIGHNAPLRRGGTEFGHIEYPNSLKDSIGSLVSLPPYAGHLVLMETNGPTPGRQYELPKAGNVLVVGRSPETQICIDSLKVSRRHAQISVYENSIMVVDLGSGNGTFVGGDKVTRRLLHPGERIHFADRICLLCHSE